MGLVIAQFTKKDFPIYKDWFEDTELNTRLGPMDDDWLEYVMNQVDGCQYSVFDENKLVAVIGIILPDEKHPAYYITDFAIRPDLRGKGVGSEVLRSFLKQFPLKPGQTWKTFVDTRNPRAKTFFESNGWVCQSEFPDKDGMFELQFQSVADQAE
jgi:ribosomal protein S18 acetylase RimI-like enzyme